MRTMFLSALIFVLSSGFSQAAKATPPLSGEPQRVQWLDGTDQLRSARERQGLELPTIPESRKMKRASTVVTEPLEHLDDVRLFWIMDFTNFVATGEANMNEEKYQVPARLRTITDHAYLYVEDGLFIDQTLLDDLVSDFDSNMYPNEARVFGQVPDALDGDPRVTILVATFAGTSAFGGTIAGYFDDSNQYTDTESFDKELGHSCEREIVYINEMFVTPDSILGTGITTAKGILAHEYQHLTHWGRDLDESVWFNEACSDYAMILTGYEAATADHTQSYVTNPTGSLVEWGDNLESYGATLYFLRYVLAHYGGEPSVTTLAFDKLNGLYGYDAFLRKNYNITFREVYRDWLITNILSEYSGLYSYPFDETPNYYRQLYTFLGIDLYFTANVNGVDGTEQTTYLERWAMDAYLFHRAPGELGQDTFLSITAPADSFMDITYVGLNEFQDILATGYKFKNRQHVQLGLDGKGDFQIPKDDPVFALIVAHTPEDTEYTSVTYSFTGHAGVATNVVNDLTPPAVPMDIALDKTEGDRAFLSWTAPGDDGELGWAAIYDLRYSTTTLTTQTFATAQRIPGLSHPMPGGHAESFICPDLPENSTLHIMLRTEDDAGNESWSPTITATTTIHDTLPPARVTDLGTVVLWNGGAEVAWTAPGGSGNTGQAEKYDVRFSPDPITNEYTFRHAYVTKPPEPKPAGQRQSVTLSDLPWNRFYVALRAYDDLGNVSEISNLLLVTPTAGKSSVIRVY